MEGFADGKRKPKPTIQILENNLEDSSAKLESILSSDIPAIETDPNSLKKLCSDIKLLLNKFVADSKVLASRYAEHGSPSQSQEVQSKRRDLKQDAANLIKGINVMLSEKGFDQNGKCIVQVDPRYFRPTEVDSLLGDPSKAKEKLGWVPEITAQEMCAEMVAADVVNAKRTKLLRDHGLEKPHAIEN